MNRIIPDLIEEAKAEFAFHCLPRIWGRTGAEIGLVALGILVTCAHLNVNGLLHWQGLDWSGLLAKYFTPAWAATAATIGYILGVTSAIAARVISMGSGVLYVVARFAWSSLKSVKA